MGAVRLSKVERPVLAQSGRLHNGHFLKGSSSSGRFQIRLCSDKAFAEVEGIPCCLLDRVQLMLDRRVERHWPCAYLSVHVPFITSRYIDGPRHPALFKTSR
jgi:hypothetical protein